MRPMIPDDNERRPCQNPAMIFSWLRRRRRRKLLALPFPDEWRPWLEELPFYQGLDDEERSGLHDITRVLVAEKTWEGCGGLTITEEMKVVIAAQAALLLLNIEHDFYRRAQSILVYPSAYDTGRPEMNEGGIFGDEGANEGEAWYGGPVILNWNAVKYGVDDQKDAQNLVLHEFAHKLDMMDGYVDGTPPLAHREDYPEWTRVMTEEYDALRGKARKRKRSVLNPYGATNEAEFFAVATESFFEKPLQMEKRHAELYGLLKAYYRQDPAGRLRRRP
jgi:MtfA peptidase